MSDLDTYNQLKSDLANVDGQIAKIEQAKAVNKQIIQSIMDRYGVKSPKELEAKLKDLQTQVVKLVAEANDYIAISQEKLAELDKVLVKDE